MRDGTSARAGSRPPNLGLIYVDAGAESDGASQTCACGTEVLQRTKGSERKTKVESRDGWCTLRVAGLNWEGHESRAPRSVNRLGSRAPQHLAVVQPKTDVRERACALLLKLPNWNAEGASSCASLASEIRIQVRVG